MANIAILIGNTSYQTLGRLDCCSADVLAMRELLDATGKFEHIEVIVDRDSSSLKECIRTAVDSVARAAEVFFYFTGHGYQSEADFFYCATDFTAKRPNETGLSNAELHTLLRSPEAELVVKVIDACNSGTLLVKSDDFSVVTAKQGFKNLIQIASCLDSQNSLAGEPLSPFTERFRAAALRKPEGVIYYADIINTLRDDFLENTAQTPHFVSQGTGREEFVADAQRLAALRAKLAGPVPDAGSVTAISPSTETTSDRLRILEQAEKQFATKDVAQAFISRFFDDLIKKSGSDGSLSEAFTAECAIHSDFMESTTRAFIIRVLSREKRPDNFVTAEISYQSRMRDPLGLAGFASLLGNPDDRVANYDLRLNCQMDKAQLRIALNPKFLTLKQFVLVVSCAPSLDYCYIMEMLTQHPLKDWGTFDADGDEIVRRWYKRRWTDGFDDIVEKIWEKIETATQESVEATLKSLGT